MAQNINFSDFTKMLTQVLWEVESVMSEVRKQSNYGTAQSNVATGTACGKKESSTEPTVTYPLPTGDLTMASISAYDLAKQLKLYVEYVKHQPDFDGTADVIGQLTIAIRSLEDAESRILRAKKVIIS